jgi:hypothetical protein
MAKVCGGGRVLTFINSVPTDQVQAHFGGLFQRLMAAASAEGGPEFRVANRLYLDSSRVKLQEEFVSLIHKHYGEQLVGAETVDFRNGVEAANVRHQCIIIILTTSRIPL